MCYYNGQKVTRDEFIRLKQLEKAIAQYDFLNKPLQVGFDYNANAVLKRIPDQEDFDIVQMEWGFIPHYLKTRSEVVQMRNGYYDKDKQFRPPMVTLNAVCEELLKDGKVFREAALYRRCLVLSTGFFEWRHIYPLNKRTGQPVKKAVTYPYYITLKDKSYFYMAGIWQPWTDKETGEYVESFAIVTTKANSLMEQIHNTKKRMPTILNEDLAYEWLLGDVREDRILEIAATQYPSETMEACPVARDFREALEPTQAYDYKDLPPLDGTPNVVQHALF